MFVYSTDRRSSSRVFLFIFLLASLTSPPRLFAQSTRQRSRQSPTTRTAESAQPVSPRLLGPYKSREDNGPYVQVVYRNDLILIIKEHHATPLASITVLVKVPELPPNAENELLLQIAALTIFPSSEDVESAPPDSSIQAMGGITTTAVTPDRLQWTLTLPAESIPKAYPLIVERLAAVEPSPSLVASALKHLSRIEAFGDSNDSSQEVFLLAGFPSTIAVPSEVSQDLLNSFRQFLKRVLQASHMVVSIVGDIDREKTIQRVGENFLALPAGESKPKMNPPTSNPTAGLHYALLRSTDGQAALSLYFPAKSAYDPAFAILSSLLVRGEMSHLRHDLISQKALISSLSAHSLVVEGENYLTIHFSCPPENLDEASVYLIARLRQFASAAPSDDEILRARRQFALAWSAENRAPATISQTLAEYEAGPGYMSYMSMPARVEKVTAQELYGTTSDLFSLDHIYGIEHWPFNPASRSFNADTYKDFLSLAVPRAVSKIGKRVEQASANLPPIKERPSPYLGNFDRSQLKEAPWNKYAILRGPTVYVSEFHLSPLVTFEVLYPGGQFFESHDSAGMTALTVMSAIQSTQSKTHDELWFQLESLGATLLPIVKDDLFGYALIIPPSTASAGIEVLLEMIQEPHFSPDDVATAKSRLVENLRSQLMSPRTFAEDKIKTTFFSHTDLYPTLNAQIANIQKATEKEVSAWWTRIQKDILPTLFILGDTEGTEFVAPFARKLSSSTWRAPALEPLTSIKTPKLPVLLQEPRENAQFPLLTLGFAGAGFGTTSSDAIEVGQWLFSDVFDRTRVSEFHYLRFFEGTRMESGEVASGWTDQVVKQMSKALANDAAIISARKRWQTDSILRDLDPVLKGFSFFRRSLFSPDVDFANKTEQTIAQMPVAQLREALLAVFTPQNMIACLLVPQVAH